MRSKCLPDFASVSEAKMSVYVKRLFTLAAEQRNDGIIHSAHLESLLCRSGFNFPNSAISRILQETTSGDGTIPFEEHSHAVYIVRQEAVMKGNSVLPKVLGRAAVSWAAGNRERKARALLQADCFRGLISAV